jgi:hypothetical protein
VKNSCLKEISIMLVAQLYNLGKWHKNRERDMCQLFKAMGAGLSIKMSGYAKECFGYKRVSRNAQK